MPTAPGHPSALLFSVRLARLSAEPLDGEITMSDIEHPEALYLLESLIRAAGEDDPSLLDLHVIDALDAARRWFAAEQEGRTFRPRLTDPRAEELFTGLRAAGEFLLGRPTEEIEVRLEERPDPIGLDALVYGFRRLEKSAKLWTNEGGRRGYLSYIGQFLPS
jgi:hypothetical protein